MKKKLNGLTTINIELTNICNHKCWCCGRRQREKENPEIKNTYKHMDFDLLKHISSQVPEDIVIQFHNNGDPLEYPYLKEALDLFPKNIRCFNTKISPLLLKKRDILKKLTTLTLSQIPKDPDWKNQYVILNEFLELKQIEKPNLILRLTGEIEKERVLLYEDLAKKYGCLIVHRVLHSSRGSFDYQKIQPTIPEIGICLDFLNHLAIDVNGNVSICVRFDPEGLGILGNIKQNRNLYDIWYGEKRQQWLKLHKQFKRNEIPLCSTCDYWGVPTGK